MVYILGDSKEIAQICGDEGKQFHVDMKRILKRSNDYNRRGTTEDAEHFAKEVESVLNLNFASMRLKKFACKIFKERDKLLVFVTNPEGDGTNNRAERAVRPNVVLRKVSRGPNHLWGQKYRSICIRHSIMQNEWNGLGRKRKRFNQHF